MVGKMVPGLQEKKARNDLANLSLLICKFLDCQLDIFFDQMSFIEKVSLISAPI